MGNLSPAAALHAWVSSAWQKVTAIQDGSDYLLGALTKLRNVAGTIINPMTDEQLTDVIDSNNSSTSQLSGDAVFTGISTDVLGYRAITVSVWTDEDSAEHGIEIQFSIDGTNWGTSYADSLFVVDGNGKSITVPVLCRYFRLKYTNGATATTELDLKTELHRIAIPRPLYGEGVEFRPSTQSNIVGGIDEDRHVRWLRVDDENYLRVVVREPVQVTQHSGGRSYYHNNLVNVDEPAEITTGADEPYDVGGDTLTISVDGGANQTPTFATRAALAGIHYSAPHPRTTNPDHEKLKVSIDGGALVEVKIGKGWTTGAAIAAALQTQIRANVPNGTNMTVEYDTAEYPYRYVFKSGTTGSSSIMHVEKGGDDLAKKVLFVDVVFGGTERIGLNADNYWAFEVIDFLTTELSDVQVVADGSGVSIRTVSQGSSASLQVTSGGANTALQFPTTITYGTTGSGDDDMAVDGSTTSVRYAVVPPTGRVFVVNKLHFFVRDNGIALNKFASLDPLTNGVTLETKNENLQLIPEFVAVTSADLMSQAAEGEIVDNGWTSGGQDLLKAVFDFSPGLSVTEGGVTNFVVTIQDDLSSLVGAFYVRASGWIEEETA